MNIFEKILKIQNELETVAKNLKVGDGKYSYNAVGEGDILKAVKPLEEKYGVMSYPTSRQVIESEVLETVKEYNGNTTTSTQKFMRIEITYRFVNIEKPDEFIETISYGDGIDTMDKATGKAMTYADKYALMKMYKIQTGDDPDQTHSNDYGKIKVETITEEELTNLIQKLKQFTPEEQEKMKKWLGVKKLIDLNLSKSNYDKLIKFIDKKEKEILSEVPKDQLL